MSAVVSSHQLTAYANPQAGQAQTASVVLGNDNTTVTGYNAHDADPTIHVQSSTLAQRPAATATPSVQAGSLWFTSDGLRLYYSTGTIWSEAAYLPTVGGTIAGAGLTGSQATSTLTITDTWNTSGNPTAVKLNITNTASGSTALLMDLQISGNTRFRVSKLGTVLIGNGQTAVHTQVGVGLDASLALTGNADQNGFVAHCTMGTDATTYGGFTGFAITPAAVFTIASTYVFHAQDGVIGAGSAITTQYGLYVDALTAGGTNYSIYTNTGLVRFGGAVTATTTLDVTGNFAVNTSKFAVVASSGATTIAGTLTAAAANFSGAVAIIGAATGYTGLTVIASGLAGVDQHGIDAQITGSSGATSSIAAIYVLPKTAVAAYTATSVYGIYIDDATKGAGSTITNQYGLYIVNQSQGGTLKYAIKCNGGRVALSLPTSSAGLASGDLWANSGVVTVV